MASKSVKLNVETARTGRQGTFVCANFIQIFVAFMIVCGYSQAATMAEADALFKRGKWSEATKGMIHLHRAGVAVLNTGGPYLVRRSPARSLEMSRIRLLARIA